MHLTSVLTYAGSLPFVAAAGFALAGKHISIINFAATDVARAYGLIIATLMASALWGYRQRTSEARCDHIATLLVSNLIALVRLGVALFASKGPALWFLAASFVAILWIDYQDFQREIISKTFFQLRAEYPLLSSSHSE